MSENGDHGAHVNIHIDKIINGLSSTPLQPCIYRVAYDLRSINEKAYEPKIIAIGPLHRDKEHLQELEYHKRLYFKAFLDRVGRPCVHRCVDILNGLEVEARNFYAEPTPLEKDDFVRMLLLDGIFIIEFLRKYDERMGESHGNKNLIDNGDAIFQFGHIQNHLLMDLMLFENQLPLFIIQDLFKESKANDEKELTAIIWPLSRMSKMDVDTSLEVHSIPHLLGLVHHIVCLPVRGMSGSDQIKTIIKSAKELQESGIIFKKAREERPFLSIEFRNKTLIISLIDISDATESLFRNMIAYEYYLPLNEQKYFTDYAFFINCIIHSPEDARLLRRCGIVSNLLGGDEMVYHMVNKLGKNVMLSDNFSFNNVFDKVEKHCKRRRNKWMARLRRDYFNSPWSLMSLFGVIALIVMAAMQTIFAVLSYCRDNRNANGR